MRSLLLLLLLLLGGCLGPIYSVPEGVEPAPYRWEEQGGMRLYPPWPLRVNPPFLYCDGARLDFCMKRD